MWVPMNLKLETHSTTILLNGVMQVIVSAPCGKDLHLFPVGSPTNVGDESNHGGVICKLDDAVGSMHRSAVAGDEKLSLSLLMCVPNCIHLKLVEIFHLMF